MIAPYTCEVVSIYDGDGPYRCADGRKLRMAGVQAPDFESASPCRQRKPGYVCSDRLARIARDKARAMYLGKTLDCKLYERTYDRIAAECTYRGESVSCALVKAGVGTWWKYYARRYRMRCPNG